MCVCVCVHVCVYILHSFALYFVALTSVDKGSFLDMLSNKSANEKSTKKELKVSHFIIISCCGYFVTLACSYTVASLKCNYLAI